MYYEGILQLRNYSREVLNFVKSAINKKDNVVISKEVKVKNGVDIYLSSQHFLQDLGKKLQKRFGGELKKSFKLYKVDRQTSKRVYRVNVLFRLPKFKLGDVITYKGEKIKVVSIKNKVFGKNVKTGEKLMIKFSELNF